MVITTQSLQSNGARLIYTLNDRPPTVHNTYCLLKNGYYFMKEARSDEKLRYTESEIRSIVRTVTFMYVFDNGPRESMLELINSGEPYTARRSALETNRLNELDVNSLAELLDRLFGTGFSVVARHSVTHVYTEYMYDWRYYLYGQSVSMPSTDDFVRVSRFVNVPSCRYSSSTDFINDNVTDHRVPLQNNEKMLDLTTTRRHRR